MRQDIEKRFKLEAKMLSVLREQFKAEVVRWVFSITEIWSNENRLLCRGSDLDPHLDVLLPGPDGALYAYGFDRADKPIVLEHFESETVFGGPLSEGPALQEIPTKELLLEEFITYQGDTLDVTRFLRSDLQAVYRMTFRDRRLIEEECFRDGYYQHTRFQYEQRRQVLQQSISEKGHVFFEIAFGPHGEQSFFRVRRDGTRSQLYQPLPKGVTVTSVKETIRDRLLALVPEIVAATKITEPIYCVALAYDGEGNDVLPPLIGVGLESERQRWRVQHGKDAWQWIWNPAEFHNFEKPHTQLEDEALEEACDRLNSKLAERDSLSPAIRLVVEVATELNKTSWPVEVQRTEDFTVYAVDFELGSLRKNLKACLAPERLAALKAKLLL